MVAMTLAFRSTASGGKTARDNLTSGRARRRGTMVLTAAAPSDDLAAEHDANAEHEDGVAAHDTVSDDKNRERGKALEVQTAGGGARIPVARTPSDYAAVTRTSWRAISSRTSSSIAEAAPFKLGTSFGLALRTLHLREADVVLPTSRGCAVFQSTPSG